MLAAPLWAALCDRCREHFPSYRCGTIQYGAFPERKTRMAISEKEEAVLRAIEELGETSDVGEIQRRANEILKEMRAKKKPH